MKLKEFVNTNVQVGDKVELTLIQYEGCDKSKTQKATVYFRGYRILCGAALAHPDELVPVFVKPTKKGEMGRFHYGNAVGEYIPWMSNIKHVKILSKAS